jgi:hydrogenase nickel incorporation protein HypA/HybF
MHELSIALSILEAAAEERRRHGSARVTAIRVRIGPLAGVVTEALLSAFELARMGWIFPAVRLEIEQAPLTIHCARCGTERLAESTQRLHCAHCGAAGERVISGRQLEFVRMEIEERASVEV